MFSRSLLVIVWCCGAAFTQDCKAKFTVVRRDDLNNVRQGLNSSEIGWLKKLEKKYPGICYESPSDHPSVLFYIWTAPAVYHGSHTESETRTTPTTATVTDQDGNVSTVQGETTTTSTYSVPDTVDYDRLFLSIEALDDTGKPRVLHNFSWKTLNYQMYGLCVRNCHPYRKMMEEAIKWIYKGGLTDPLQSVAPE